MEVNVGAMKNRFISVREKRKERRSFSFLRREKERVFYNIYYKYTLYLCEYVYQGVDF